MELDADSLAGPEINQRVGLPKRHRMWVDTGRSALGVALHEILRKGGRREAWVPAYCCEAILIPFKMLGFRIHFYSMGKDLATPDRLPRKTDGIAFLYVHYFGVKNNRLAPWLEENKFRKRFFVIEDCAQASLSGNVGETGHFAFTSYRKFLPQPDGALLVSDEAIKTKLAAPDEAFLSLKLIGKMLRARKQQEKLYLAMFESAEKLLNVRPALRRMSGFSAFMMQRTDFKKIAALRKRNWQMLNGLLKENGLSGRSVFPLYSRLGETEVPLGFPILMRQQARDRLRKFLIKRQIFCPVHWPTPYLPKDRQWSVEHELSRRLLTLPIDQRLNEASLRYMADSLRQFFKGSK